MSDQQHFQWDTMTAGVCYYPEHWPRELWAEDLERMKAAGISVVRAAEFAWSLFEPVEGVFQFDLFDDFLALCTEKGIHVIMGTPTATPPAWLTEKYPETLNCDRSGISYRHGGRRHYNYNSPVYQKLCARIVEQIARHYGSHPAVVGWQIDNELNCETDEFCSQADHAAFREFLKERYGTLDCLNQTWGTVFWSQTYTDWSQLYGPRPVLNGGYNPSMLLDYYRFVSHSARRFCKMQADIVRKYKKPEDFITTNGMFDHLDNHQMTKESLDVYTYDSYPSFAFGLDRSPKTTTDLNDRKWTRNLTEVRSVCPHFGIMEQQSGANGWTNRMEGPAPRPGQLTLWAMQSVAQGADFISFFRWRTCTFGTEIYWHGILDYDNRDNRKLAEVTDFCKKLRTLDPVCGAENVGAFALIKDYDNQWDMDVDTWHQRVAAFSEQEIFVASELNHTPYNIVYLRESTELAELTSYPVAFYPHPVMIDERRAALLASYVERGGTLILGCRSGYKDLTGKCVMLPQPGLLQKLTGTDVRDFTFTSPCEVDSFLVWENRRLEAPVFNDILTPLEGTNILARYGSSYYAGEAALTEHHYGKGRVLHLGSAFSRDMVKQLLEYSGVLEPFRMYIEAPEGVEAVLRRQGCRQFLFVLNFQSFEQVIMLKRPAKLLYTGKEAHGDIILPAFGTAVYELSPLLIYATKCGCEEHDHETKTQMDLDLTLGAGCDNRWYDGFLPRGSAHGIL